MSVRLYTSRYSNPLMKTWEGVKLGATLYTPRWPLGYAVVPFPILAPTRELFGIHDRERFETAFRQRLDSIGFEAIMAALRQLSGNADAVCVLCFEDVRVEGVWCHRETVAAWLRENGVPVEELPDTSAPKPKVEKTERAQGAKVQQAMFSFGLEG
jgi:hypothetical protein